MFDCDISLFVLSMSIIIMSYFDCSHVSIEFQCIFQGSDFFEEKEKIPT